MTVVLIHLLTFSRRSCDPVATHLAERHRQKRPRLSFATLAPVMFRLLLHGPGLRHPDVAPVTQPIGLRRR